MSLYVLIHGGGDAAANFELLAGELRARGHGVVAVDLPSEDESAGLWDFADTVVTAIRASGDESGGVAGDRGEAGDQGRAGDRGEVVVVAHSLGGFTGPLVCERTPVDLLVLVAAMVPAPGESAEEWWENTRYADAGAPGGGDVEVFFHDVEPELAEAALANARGQTDKAMREPWPLEAWPAVPTRYLLCRDDRMFPAAWTRELVQRRLGITPDEIDGGHCPFLSRPKQLADRLEAYTTTTTTTGDRA